MNIHEKHRQRVKKRFRDEGLDHFEELHALELLLFYAVPQKDTNDLAHDLLDHFGNLHQVLTAPPEQLMQIKGVGEHVAILLSLVKGISQKYLIGQEDDRAPLNTMRDCGKYLMDRFLGRRDETVMLLCLDARRVPLACRIVSEGSVNAADGFFMDGDEKAFTAEDFRFTYGGGNVYAFWMRPEGKTATIRTLASKWLHDFGIENVSLLGGGDEISFPRDQDGLHICLPKTVSGEFPLCFKIQLA